ncbi:MAG TPA: DUF1906 domain-containing protein [Bauldia sp.]|nr:DUF1906 domain-containing protein [Bauldia sp.]
MIVDTNRRTTPHLACLRNRGVTAIIRYYARMTRQPEKRLTRAEAEAIVAAGLHIGVVFQSAGDSAACFGRRTGLKDGVHSRSYAASVIGQPEGSAIYFAVDYNADGTDLKERIVPYFEAVGEAFARSPRRPDYRIGVYGNGIVCATLLDKGLAELAWLSQSTGHHGHEAFKKSNRWTLFQHPAAMLCTIGIDEDELRPGAADFGGFDRLLAPPGLAAIGTAEVMDEGERAS